ncbi:MAG: flagellar assembly protein FliW [Planctomycetes bacterium]|nr:flagellar assembly protein FliW [Planctomycetota bacterium]
MDVNTTRFGVVDVDDTRLITFPAGLLGFTAYKTYALLQPDANGAFLWLQSVESPELAFVVTDPTLWVQGYEVPIRREQMQEIGLESLDDAQIFVIVNRHGLSLTVNVQGPLVVNAAGRRGMQVVLAEKRWTTRHEIVQVETPVQAASA